MRDSAFARVKLALALLGLALAWGSARLGAAELEPVFRLPVGGRAWTSPIIDQRASPAAVWILSEDRSLYLITEGGVLLSRTIMPAPPAPFLCLDRAGRALVLLPGAQGAAAGGQVPGEARLLAYTRIGRVALAKGLGPLLSSAAAADALQIALGADGRLFLGAGKVLRCLAPSGSLLWELALPAPISCPLATDGAGRLLAGLVDGSLMVFSPFGRREARLATGSPLSALAPFAVAPWRALARAPSLPLFAFGTVDGRLGLGRADGKAATRLDLGSAPLSFATDALTLYALGAAGRIAAVTQEGKVLWSVETGVKAGRLSLYADRLIATGKGRAVTVNLNGAILREATFTNSSGPCIVSPTGLLFSPGADWIVGAYNFERSLGAAVLPAIPPYGDDEGIVEDGIGYDPLIAESGRRLGLLADIEEALDEGSLGEDEGRAGALASAIALGLFEKDYPAAVARFRQDPLPRSRAVHLIGRLGSPDRLEVLFEVFRKDSDSAVRAGALDAIAEIGLDPQGQAGEVFQGAVLGSTGRLDDEVAFSLARAIETLALRSGNPPQAGSIRALLALCSAPYGQDVRNAATKALGHIAGTFGP